MTERLKKILGHPAWLLLLVFVAIGFMLLSSSSWFAARVPLAVLDGMWNTGTILLPSLAIGYVLSYGFSRKLTEDAFKAAVGYILSPELRSELQWIYEQDIVCHQSICDFWFTLIDKDTVRAEMEAYRVFRNDGAGTGEMQLGLQIDEWANPAGKSKIEYFRYDYRGMQFEITPDNATYEVRPHSISLRLKKPIEVKRGERLTVTFRTIEYKRAQDDAFLSFTKVTLRPLIKVHFDKQELELNAAMSHRLQKQPISDHFELEGALLPGQHIRIWWWPVGRSINSLSTIPQQAGDPSLSINKKGSQGEP
jgi:hypothetical protein